MPKENEWVMRARQGDLEAFTALVQANESKIYTLALRMTGNPEDARDLAQEAFLTAFRRLSAFRMESSFSTWLYRLTSNLCIDFLRREKRRKIITCPMEDGEGKLNELPDRRYDPQTELERSETRRMLEWGLAQLSAEHREILILRELNELSYEEIGTILHLEPGTVKSRLARARLRLREILITSGNSLVTNGNISRFSSSKKTREEGAV